MKATRAEQLDSGKWVEFIYDNGTTGEWELELIRLPRRTFTVLDFEEAYARFCDAKGSEPLEITSATDEE